jgi:hypothetical protein
MEYFPQNKTKQNKTKQNKTKQNKTKQNKTKQNKFFEELWREFWAEESESLGNVLPRESRKRALPEEPAMVLLRATIVNGDGSTDEKAALASLGELSVKCWQVDDYLPELVGESKVGRCYEEAC